MKNKQNNKAFNKRSFVAIALLISGLLLPFSGWMNHELQYESLTTARHFWMTFHNVAGILFTIFAIIHSYYNWKAMRKYINKAKEMVLTKEAISAFALVIIIVGLISAHAYIV